MIDFNKANFLVVGLARNCESSIQNDIKKINNAFSNSNLVKWLVIESDSSDETLTILQQLKKDIDLDYSSLGKLADQYPLRTERIALCRNEYLKQIRSNTIYDEIDYVVVADLDDVNIKLESTSVEQCWNLNEKWDACFANQSGPYYDIWALRHPLWSPNDCYMHENYLKSSGYKDFLARYLAVYSRMITLPSNSKPIQVDSAFGGLGIYTKEFFNEGSYIGVDSDNNEICEHVSFHIDRTNNTNLFIIPSLINCGLNEHSKQSKFYNLFLLFCLSCFMSFHRMQQIRHAYGSNDKLIKFFKVINRVFSKIKLFFKRQ